MVVDKTFKITTLGSHSALQILKGAKDEGFSTIAVCVKGTEKPYKQFKVADKVITIDSYDDFICSPSIEPNTLRVYFAQTPWDDPDDYPIYRMAEIPIPAEPESIPPVIRISPDDFNLFD